MTETALNILPTVVQIAIWILVPGFLTLYSASRRHPYQGYALTEWVLFLSALGGLIGIASILISKYWVIGLTLYYLGCLLILWKGTPVFGVGTNSSATTTYHPDLEPKTGTFIRIQPTSERPLPEDLAGMVKGFQQIEDKSTTRYNPFSPPLKFESLILDDGTDAPIKFLIRPNDPSYIKSLRTKLTSEYPSSYDISVEEINLSKHLLPPSVYESRFGDTSPASTTVTDGGALSADGAGLGSDDTASRDSLYAEGDELLSGGDAGSSKASHAPDDPSVGTLQPEDFDGVDTYGVQWVGKEERRQDWQTLTKRYTQQTKRQRQKEGTERRSRASPLAELVEAMTDIDHPVAFQTVFQRRRQWARKSSWRKRNIDKGIDTPLDAVGTLFTGALDAAVGNAPDTNSEEGENEASESVDDTGLEMGGRISHISKKQDDTTFKVNLRCLTFVPDDVDAQHRTGLQDNLEAISNSFNHLSGPYYDVTGRIVTDATRNKLGKRPTRSELLNDFVSQNIRVTLTSKTRLQLILNHDELANYIGVPSNEELTDTAVREIQSTLKSQSPLPLPDKKNLKAYTNKGLEIGVPLNEHREAIDIPVRVPPQVLHHHYVRAAVTGSGKSIAETNSFLSMSQYTSGPNILIEPKGGSMASDYLQAHYEKYGTLDNVIYFDIPNDLPAMPLFDIRPNLAAGDNREDAIQDTINHFQDIMEVVMDEEQFKRAQESVSLLKLLIRANFDHKYGSDAFTLDELQQTLAKFIQERKIPQVSDENKIVHRSLNNLLEGDESMLESITNGADGRLRKLGNEPRLEDMFNYLPDWDINKGGLRGGGESDGFHFYNILDKDVTIIFDIGDLNKQMKRGMSLLILSYLWSATKMETRGSGGQPERPDDYVIGCIVEEAKELSEADLLTDFLAWGREFGICLGLLMQFPQQMQGEELGAVYDEIIQNTGTKIFGKLENADEVADLLSHDELTSEEVQNRLSFLSSGEWLVKLKEPEFFQTLPVPFSVKSMKPPAGHPEGDGLSRQQQKRFGKEYERMLSSVQNKYCVPKDKRSHMSGGDDSPDPNEEGTQGKTGFGDVTNGDSSLHQAGGSKDAEGPRPTDGTSDGGSQRQQATSEQETAAASGNVFDNYVQDHPTSTATKSTGDNSGTAHSSTKVEPENSQDVSEDIDGHSAPDSPQKSSESSKDGEPSTVKEVRENDDINIKMEDSVKDHSPTNPEAASSTSTQDSEAQPSPSHSPEDTTTQTSKDAQESHNSSQADDAPVGKTRSDAVSGASNGQHGGDDNSVRKKVAEDADNPFASDGNEGGDRTETRVGESSNQRRRSDSGGRPTENRHQPANNEQRTTGNRRGQHQNTPTENGNGEQRPSRASQPEQQASNRNRDASADTTADSAPQSSTTTESPSQEQDTAQSQLSGGEQGQHRPKQQDAGSSSPPSQHRSEDNLSNSREGQPKNNHDEPESESSKTQSSVGIKYLSKYRPGELENLPISRDAVTFIGEIYEVLTNPEGVEYYDLTESMTSLREYTPTLANALIDGGYIEKQSGPRNRTYFSPTNQAYNILNLKKPVGENQGDVGEKTVHKIVCHLVAQYWESKSSIETVKRYVEIGDRDYDVVAYGPSEEPVWVAEVETGSNNAIAIGDDYQKLCEIDAKGFWIVDKKKTMSEVIKTIQSRCDGYSGVSPYNGYAKVREQMQNAGEGHAIYSFDEIYQLISSQEN
jgi:DNA helicase HerA-like ATPase